jgi:hypothetical protein
MIIHAKFEREAASTQDVVDLQLILYSVELFNAQLLIDTSYIGKSRQ